jgi:hypothetical protein
LPRCSPRCRCGARLNRPANQGPIRAQGNTLRAGPHSMQIMCIHRRLCRTTRPALFAHLRCLWAHSRA